MDGFAALACCGVGRVSPDDGVDSRMSSKARVTWLSPSLRSVEAMEGAAEETVEEGAGEAAGGVM